MVLSLGKKYVEWLILNTFIEVILNKLTYLGFVCLTALLGACFFVVGKDLY